MARDSRAAPDKGVAARDEKQPREKTVDFLGLTLTLPPKMPGAVALDMGIADLNNAIELIGLLDGVIGRDQYRAVRAKVVERGLDFEAAMEPISRLVADVFAVYGMTQGESRASPES